MLYRRILELYVKWKKLGINGYLVYVFIEKVNIWKVIEIEDIMVGKLVGIVGEKEWIVIIIVIVC